MLYLPCFQNWQMSWIPWWYYRNELFHLKDRQSRNPSELQSHWIDDWMNEVFPPSSMKRNLIFPYQLFPPSSFVGQNISEVVLTPEPTTRLFPNVCRGWNKPVSAWTNKDENESFFLEFSKLCNRLINSAIIHIFKLRDLKLLLKFFFRRYDGT